MNQESITIDGEVVTIIASSYRNSDLLPDQVTLCEADSIIKDFREKTANRP